MRIKTYPLRAAVVSLLFSGFAFAQQSETDIINRYFNTYQKKSAEPATTFDIINIQNDKTLNGKVVQIRQTYNDIPVYGAVSSVLLQKDEVAYLSDSFTKIAAEKNRNLKRRANFDVQNGFAKVLQNAHLKGDISPYTFEKKKHNTVLYELAYYPKEDGSLQLVYVVNFFEDKTNNYWNLIIDAENGQLIQKSNLTLSCKFSDTAYSHDHLGSEEFLHKAAEQERTNIPAATSKLVESASYKVFALPVEAPTFGSRTIETNPWYADSSPLGWHNDGETAYTITRGNNTYTYADEIGDNSFGASADGGSSRVFDFPLNDAEAPETYKNAAITNLFYLTNKMHDISYRFGFNEEGRNFQSNNFGKGEELTDSDPVLAEARDGGGLNNANFATPPDGYAPRMQMYLWQVRNFLNYNTPEDLMPRKPVTGTNTDFGKLLSSTPVTSDVLLVSPADACTDLDTDLTGKIALIKRGTCSFDVKFRKAQDKGAVAVIIYNVDPTQGVGDMVGSGLTVSIPGVLVDHEEGTTIKSKLDAGINVNVSLSSKARLLDGSLDNGIIAHEYTHGITTRSTGNGYSCLNPFYANEQMGEGWSDFYALLLTNPANASASTPRGVGTYVGNQPITGRGIRPAQYSPDFAVNGYTYADTNGMAFDAGDGTYDLDVHSIGFVWATMLWDLHWKFAEKYGFSNDIANNMNSGSAKILQVVNSALKLQGCNPSFVKGRDAIIQADQAINNGENKCMIWNAFARRGLGVHASPGKTSGSGNQILSAISDQVEDFTVPAECETLATQDVALNESSVSLYPNPAKNEVFIKTKDAGQKKVSVSIYDASGRKLSEQMVRTDADSINTSALSNGVYIIKGEGIGINFSKKLLIKK